MIPPAQFDCSGSSSHCTIDGFIYSLHVYRRAKLFGCQRQWSAVLTELRIILSIDSDNEDARREMEIITRPLNEAPMLNRDLLSL